jgi:cytochrome P450
MTAVHYDPYDVDIDDDPYPTWRRLRDEAPLYRNDQLDFFALSRWDDVKPALIDWETYRSGRGTVLEVVSAGVEIPPGLLLWEDPPIHDAHRGLLSRVFTLRRMLDLEPLVRSSCVAAIDALVDRDEFDVIDEFGIEIPLRTIGSLFGIPEADQDAYRKRTDERSPPRYAGRF